MAEKNRNGTINMTPQQKEDLVCPFHGDLEGWMRRIDNKLAKLLLWKASVIGYSMGACGAVMLFFKLLKII
jgi:hypothetical protein